MRVTSVNYLFFCAFGATGVGLGACGVRDASFQVQDNPPAAAPPPYSADAETAIVPDDQAKPQEAAETTIDPEQRAKPPEMVTGAYLTCAVDEAGSTATDVRTACGLVRDPSQPTDYLDLNDVTIGLSVTDTGGQQVELQWITKSPDHKLLFFNVPRAIGAFTVEASVSDLDGNVVELKESRREFPAPQPPTKAAADDEETDDENPEVSTAAGPRTGKHSYRIRIVFK